MAQVTRQRRLYGMMQFLLTHAAQRSAPGCPPAREIVTEQDALTAVIALAAAIDQKAQAGTIPADDAAHMAEMLMVVREYIKPLPRVAETDDADEPDRLNPDLEAAVAEIRSTAEQTGVHG